MRKVVSLGVSISRKSMKRSVEELRPLLNKLTDHNFSNIPLDRQRRLVRLFKNISESELQDLELTKWPNSRYTDHVQNTYHGKGYPGLLKLATANNRHFDLGVIKLFCKDKITESVFINMMLASASIKDGKKVSISPVFLDEKTTLVWTQNGENKQTSLHLINGWSDIPTEEKMGWNVTVLGKERDSFRAYNLLLSQEFLIPVVFESLSTRFITSTDSQSWIIPSPKILESLSRDLFGTNIVSGCGVLGKSNPIDIFSGLRKGTRDVSLVLNGIRDFSGIVHEMNMGHFGVGVHDLFHLFYASKVHKDTRRLALDLATLIRSIEADLEGYDKVEVRENRDRLIDLSGLNLEMTSTSNPLAIFLNGVLDEGLDNRILDKWAQDIHRNPEKWCCGEITILKTLDSVILSQIKKGRGANGERLKSAAYLFLKVLCEKNPENDVSSICDNFFNDFFGKGDVDKYVLSILQTQINHLMNVNLGA